jgi:hypothetical protein
MNVKYEYVRNESVMDPMGDMQVYIIPVIKRPVHDPRTRRCRPPHIKIGGYPRLQLRWRVGEPEAIHSQRGYVFEGYIQPGNIGNLHVTSTMDLHLPGFYHYEYRLGIFNGRPDGHFISGGSASSRPLHTGWIHLMGVGRSSFGGSPATETPCEGFLNGKLE